jgi:hypothetical protein
VPGAIKRTRYSNIVVQPRQDQLEQAYRLAEVAQTVTSEVPKNDAFGERSRDKFGGRARQQHLTAVGRRRNTRRLMDGQTHPTALAEGRRSRVKSRSDPHRRPSPPVMDRKSALARGNRRYRASRIGERHRETIARVAHLHAPARDKGSTPNAVMVGQHPRPRLTQHSRQPRRALNIGQQERVHAHDHRFPSAATYRPVSHAARQHETKTAPFRPYLAARNRAKKRDGTTPRRSRHAYSVFTAAHPPASEREARGPDVQERPKRRSGTLATATIRSSTRRTPRTEPPISRTSQIRGPEQNARS